MLYSTGFISGSSFWSARNSLADLQFDHEVKTLTCFFSAGSVLSFDDGPVSGASLKDFASVILPLLSSVISNGAGVLIFSLYIC